MGKELKLNVARISKLSNLGAAFGNIYAIIIGGAYFTGYALRLGANNFQIGCLAAIPFLATTFQVFSSYWFEKRGSSRKKVWMTLISINRSLWLLIAALPFLLHTPVLRLYVFFSLVALSYIIGAMPTSLWWSWLADIIPEEIRGRFFGRRNAIVGVVTIASSLVLGWLLDRFTDEKIFLGFGLLFLLAVISGCMEVYLHKFIPEPEVKKQANPSSFFCSFKRVFQNVTFRRFVLFFTTLTFSVQIMMPFVAVFMLEKLKLNYFTISFLGVLFLILNIFFSNIWGPLLDKIGHKRILNICGWGMVFIPLFWVFAAPNYILPLFISSIITGVFSSGMDVLYPRLLLGLSPEESRSICVANFTMLVSLSGFLASLSAGFLSQLFNNFNITVKGFEIDSLKLLFILSSLLRCLCLFFKPSLEKEFRNPSVTGGAEG